MTEEKKWEESSKKALSEIDAFAKRLRQEDQFYNAYDGIKDELEELSVVVLKIMRKFKTLIPKGSDSWLISLTYKIRESTEFAILKNGDIVTHGDVKNESNSK
jgi:hypothetical protein